MTNNTKPPIPLAYAIHMKETYESLDLILKSIKYVEHGWRVCADLKVISLLSGMKSEWPKHACFLCTWNTRFEGNQYNRTDWPLRQNRLEEVDSIVKEELVPTEKILLPPLHIKLGVMKNFIKSLQTDSCAVQFLRTTFPHISFAKIKEGVFVGPDIRKLMKCGEFDASLTADHLIAWKLMKETFHGFLGKSRIETYQTIIKNLLIAFNNIGVKMSLKIHFLHCHLDVFERQMPTESDEQGKRFHQTCMTMEERYRNKNLQSFIADLCWSLTQNDDLQA